MKLILIILLVILTCFAFKVQAQNDIKITDAQTVAVFNFLFGANQASDFTITEQDKNKAIEFIKNLVKSSCEMSIVESLNNVNDTLSSLVKGIATSINGCENAKNGKYYESIRVTLARNFRSEFLIRKNTGEW
jgi:hypothetical protein